MKHLQKMKIALDSQHNLLSQFIQKFLKNASLCHRCNTYPIHSTQSFFVLLELVDIEGNIVAVASIVGVPLDIQVSVLKLAGIDQVNELELWDIVLVNALKSVGTVQARARVSVQMLPIPQLEERDLH